MKQPQESRCLKRIKSKRLFWLGLALSALSGILLILAMPGFDVPLLGWIVLTPLLVVLLVVPPIQVFLLTLPFAIIFSIGVHNWYPQIFPPALGYFLILAVAGLFYAAIRRVSRPSMPPRAFFARSQPTGVWTGHSQRPLVAIDPY